MRQVIFANQKGLGASGTIQSPGDIPVTFTFYGSCWTSESAKMASVDLLIDGKVVATGYIFSNVDTVHRTFVPVSFTMNLDPNAGKPEGHTATIQPGADTTIDDNDFFTLVMDY